MGKDTWGVKWHDSDTGAVITTIIDTIDKQRDAEGVTFKINAFERVS